MLSVLRREEGQGLVEYGLIVFMIAIVLIGALMFFSQDILTFFTNLGTTFGNM